MLSRRTWPVACLAVALYVLLTGAGTAQADPTAPGGSLEDCAASVICVGAHAPGAPGAPGGSSDAAAGGTTGGAGSATCSWAGKEYPCYDPDLGSFNNADGCYWSKSDLPPDPGDPAWAGHDPSEGAVYDRVCRQADGTLAVADSQWLAQPPAAEPPPDPAVLAAEAVEDLTRLGLPAPALHTAPGGADGTPLVGLATWFWMDPLGEPPHQEAAAGGVTVRATATLKKATWHFGDGTSIQCSVPGTPYRASYGAARPDCGHRYSASSAGQPHDRFSVSVTLSWDITATIEGTGTQPVPPIAGYASPGAELQLRVGELQVLN